MTKEDDAQCLNINIVKRILRYSSRKPKTGVPNVSIGMDWSIDSGASHVSQF